MPLRRVLRLPLALAVLLALPKRPLLPEGEGLALVLALLLALTLGLGLLLAARVGPLWLGVGVVLLQREALEDTRPLPLPPAPPLVALPV